MIKTCLWTNPKINATSVIAIGFEITEIAGDNSDIMQKVALDFLDKYECTNVFSHLSKKFNRGIIDDQLCIGSITGGKDTCLGDSGGPVQTLTEPKGCTYHILGITSVGSSCGIGRSPPIYTRVSAYVQRIEKHVWQSKE